MKTKEEVIVEIEVMKKVIARNEDKQSKSKIGSNAYMLASSSVNSGLSRLRTLEWVAGVDRTKLKDITNQTGK